jgi:glycolate oxidase iron-sulfur subunit
VRISELTRDLSEILNREDLSILAGVGQGVRVAYQAPCTLQHGQKLRGAVEIILQNCGYTVVPVADGDLCCGAAGTYCLLQRKLSYQLLENKLSALQYGVPDVIATANIGCQLHLESGTDLPVRHWIELLQ